MRIEFLGTAAADAVPDPFCNCEYCQAARAAGGKSIRKRASLIINDELIIDIGPDLATAAVQRGKPFHDVGYALQTHPHFDHLDPNTMFMRADDCLPAERATLQYFLSQAAVDTWNAMYFRNEYGSDMLDPAMLDRHGLQVEIVAPWQAFMVGPYQVQSVKASHDVPTVESMLFTIRDTRDNSTCFYGTDTGPLPADTWQRLASLGWRFDVWILDHTHGFRPDSIGHLGETGFRAEMALARSAGVIDADSRIIATHFAHHSHMPHPDLVERFAPSGYEPAWDGLIIETRMIPT
ncbi:MAG: MBL fold metallo-hydrolase [Thermomicrobiales bacterium]|nr:MBL fold metallo-hydrolase [Thermomicrobiales bacterium]